jgi:hypothetical protein
MPTMNVPSQLEYGPTTAYGTVVQGMNQQATTWTAYLPGVSTQAVTHFRVTAKDAQGNVYASPDHYILTPNPVAAGTVGYINLSPNNQDTNVQWETAGPVASTIVMYGPGVDYGMTATGNLVGGGYSTLFSTDMFNLPSGSTYHYKIVTTDMSGKTYSTPDATFTIP